MRNKNKSLLIIIGLSVLIVGLSSYLFFDKMLGKSSNVTNNCINHNEKTLESLQSTIEEQESTIDNLNNILSSNNSKREVINTPDYNVITKQIAKSLIGKYVNNEDPNDYFEIKENGEISLVLNACSGYARYTNAELNWFAYYQLNSDGFERTIITLILNAGSKYTLPGSSLAITFETTDKRENKDITFKNLEGLSCVGDSYKRI